MSITPNEAENINFRTPRVDDEIDIFNLLEILWEQKVIIILFSVLFMFSGYGYTVLEGRKPIVYQGKILIETGAYVSQEKKIISLHSPADMAMMVSSISKVAARAPKGTRSLIEVKTSDANKPEILGTLDKVYEFIKQRDNQLINKLEKEQIIKITQPVGEAQISEKPIKNSSVIIFFSLITGVMLGILIALVRKAYIQHSERVLFSN